MKLKTVSFVVLIMATVGLLTPKGRLLVMSYYEKLRNLISGEEGLSLEAYQDAVGKWTIGYGHLIKPGEPYYPYGQVQLITLEEADALLSLDTQTAENCINSTVTAPLTENQRAALVSLIYNIGCAAFTSSTLLKKINALTPLPEAADEFDKWVMATQPDGSKIVLAGLVARRAREKQVFLA